MKTTKKGIYAEYGIKYKDGKILSPIGWISELLKDGNTKTGKTVHTWSILAGNKKYNIVIDNQEIKISGTCVCDCQGCYAQLGRYNTYGVKQSNGINTYLVNKHIDFVKRAISAQLETIGSGEIRIHAAGDFNTENADEYVQMWIEIITAFPSFRFWTYTKVKKYEHAFDHLINGNIVKSIIPNIGVNYGHCDYLINTYYTLKSLGYSVYICKCGFDDGQHCEHCGVCASYDFVLFLEHSTSYNAKEDPLYAKLCEIVMNQ